MIVEHVQSAVIALVDHYGYLGLFIGITLGNVGMPVGSEVLLPIAGALVATGHLNSIALTIAAALGGELTGGTIGYGIGRFGGRALVDRCGKYVGFHRERLDAMDRFFDRWGNFAIFICRFIPMIRGVSAIAAGIAEMELGPFYLWTLLGSILFCGGLVLLGNALGPRLELVLPALHRWAYTILAAAVIVAVALILVSWTRARRTLPPSA